MFVWLVDTVILRPLATASGLYLDLFLIWIGFKNDNRLKYTVPPIWHSPRPIQEKPGETIPFSNVPDLNPNKWQTSELINHSNVNRILFRVQHVQIVKKSLQKENKLDHLGATWLSVLQCSTFTCIVQQPGTRTSPVGHERWLHFKHSGFHHYEVEKKQNKTLKHNSWHSRGAQTYDCFCTRLKISPITLWILLTPRSSSHTTS